MTINFIDFENESTKNLEKSQPVVIRMEMKRSDSFKQLMDKPYDIRISEIMETLTVFLIRKANASFGFYNYNEINLVFFENVLPEKKLEIQSLVSMTTSNVVSKLASYLIESGFFDNNGNPSYENISIPNFDVKVFNVPDRQILSDYLIRRMDICREKFIRKMYEYHTGKFNGITNAGYLTTQMESNGIDIFRDKDPTLYCGKFSYRKKNPDFVSYDLGHSKNIFHTISGREFFKVGKENQEKFIDDLSL